MAKQDPGSSYSLVESIAATSQSVGASNGVTVDHNTAPSCSFLISVGTVGASGTIDGKVQMSDDNSTWVDEDGASGNDTAITQITAAGSAQLNVPNPQKRYSRVVVTVGTAASVTCATVNVGPLRHITP